MRQIQTIISIILFIWLSGCENTDLQLATEAGIDVVTAITLSDDAVLKLARDSASYMDQEHTVAPAGNEYAKRLQQLIGEYQTEDGTAFNCKVYLDDTINAFAMADGTIRIYSGLMDILNDGELRFVIGHEIGHVVKDHVRQKMQLAYAASAIRKGLASQDSTLGDIARSQLGGFAELLLGAQFSQIEEKIADDYGLQFHKTKGFEPENAITALQKLAAQGAGHSFLSSHPDPGERAIRLELQIQGKAQPIEEVQQDLFKKILGIARDLLSFLAQKLALLLSWAKSL